MANTQGRALSTLLVHYNQDDTNKKLHKEYLVSSLAMLGIPAQRVNRQGIDVRWASGGQACMFDLKTPEDVIASANDGRLHRQVVEMQAANCMMWGFLIEGEDSQDGVTVGYGPYAWPIERYDNLLLSLQNEGAKIVRSSSQDRTPQRLYSLYRYSGKEEHSSIHKPTPHKVLHGRYHDKLWRGHIEFLMGLPSLGEKKANDLIDRWPLTDILGITPEGLDAARRRWLAVDGIGKGLARDWEVWLREDFSSPALRAGGAGVA